VVTRFSTRQFHETLGGYIAVAVFVGIVVSVGGWLIIRAIGGSDSVERRSSELPPADMFSADPETPAIGVVFSYSGRPCFSVPGARLSKDTLVYAITLDPPQRVLWSKTVGQRTAGCHPGVDSSFSSYSLDESGWGYSYLDLAIGLVGLAEPPQWKDGLMYARLPDDPGPVFFRQCTSAEGIHVTGWRGTRRIWHAYIYLGYDTEYTCTDGEVE
jgi:hypothetical protein